MCFDESDMDLYCGSLPLTVNRWKEDPAVSLKFVPAIARVDVKANSDPTVNLNHPAHQNVIRVNHQLSAITNGNTSQETKGQLPISCQNLVLKKLQSKHKSTA